LTDYSSQLAKDNKILVVKERGYGMSDLKQGNIDRVNFDRANQIPTLEELTLLGRVRELFNRHSKSQ
jgi:hypothetical protein